MHLYRGREEVTVLTLELIQIKAPQSVPLKVLLIVVPGVFLHVRFKQDMRKNYEIDAFID